MRPTPPTLRKVLHAGDRHTDAERQHPAGQHGGVATRELHDHAVGQVAVDDTDDLVGQLLQPGRVEPPLAEEQRAVLTLTAPVARPIVSNTSSRRDSMSAKDATPQVRDRQDLGDLGVGDRGRVTEGGCDLERGAGADHERRQAAGDAHEAAAAGAVTDQRPLQARLVEAWAGAGGRCRHRRRWPPPGS